jgi:hypothetical protein
LTRAAVLAFAAVALGFAAPAAPLVAVEGAVIWSAQAARAQRPEDVQMPSAPDLSSSPAEASAGATLDAPAASAVEAAPVEAAPVEAAPVEAAPVEAAPATEVAAPPPPPDADHEEAEDCDVHEVQCARTCIRPSSQSTYRACLKTECSQKSESCIEKMIDALESRDQDDGDDDDDDP